MKLVCLCFQHEKSRQEHNMLGIQAVQVVRSLLLGDWRSRWTLPCSLFRNSEWFQVSCISGSCKEARKGFTTRVIIKKLSLFTGSTIRWTLISVFFLNIFYTASSLVSSSVSHYLQWWDLAGQKHPHTAKSNNLNHIKMQIAFWAQHAPPIPLWWLKFIHDTGGTSIPLKPSVCRSCSSWQVQSDVILPCRGAKENAFWRWFSQAFQLLCSLCAVFP